MLHNIVLFLKVQYENFRKRILSLKPGVNITLNLNLEGSSLNKTNDTHTLFFTLHIVLI